MPRIRLLASSLALALCSVTAAQAQQFTSFAAFGDSLSDSGNIAAASGLPAGNSFTTNPDPVAAQIIAAKFGFLAGPSLTGGTDFAWGGACVTTGPCETDPGDPTPNLGLQIGQYLLANGGHADPHGLYTYWGGANDVFGNLKAVADAEAGGGIIPGSHPIIPESPATAITNLSIDGHISGAQIAALRAAGAGDVIVFNLPDISKTPAFNALDPTVTDSERQLINAMVMAYNGNLNSSLNGMTGIIPVDTFGLFNEILANPSAYGFKNVTLPACGPLVPSLTSVACGPAGSGLPFTYDPSTVAGFAFADGVHPSGAAHAVIAQYVLAEIAAPMYASMLPEAPLQNFETQNRTINDEMQADMGGNRADGSHRAFAAFNYSHDRFDQTSTSPQTSLRDDTLVLGSDYFVNHFISFGVATTLTHQNATFGNGGSFSNNEPMLAAWGMWHTPDYWLSVLGSVGQLNFNGIDRVIQLGTATRTETANTGGSHVGFEVGGGYLFHWDEINTGPFATLSHQRVRVSSFNENGSDSTTMFFGRQDRDSTIWRVGWELNGSSKLMGGDWHPYARVAYDHETDDKARLVSAGVVGMNGTFSMPGFQPDSQFWTGELGVAADFGSNLTAFAGYDGMFGNANERVDSFNLGFKWKW